MQRFIYISSAKPETNFSDLGKIQSTSSYCNARDSLTGVLLWADNSFFQLIEGPKPFVDALVGRIHLDKRHTGILGLSYQPISEAVCENWAMGCYPMDTSGFVSEMFDADDIQSVFDRFSSIPDLEIDIFLQTFYETNVRRD